MNKYIIIEKEDVKNILNNSEKRKLRMMLDKIEVQRLKAGKDVNMEGYEVVNKKVVEQENLQAIYTAVEKALKAEREKIKKAIPNEKVVIEPDPERVTDEGAAKIAEAYDKGASEEEFKKIEEEHALKPAPSKSTNPEISAPKKKLSTKKWPPTKKKVAPEKAGVNNAKDKD